MAPPPLSQEVGGPFGPLRPVEGKNRRDAKLGGGLHHSDATATRVQYHGRPAHTGPT